MLLETVAIGTPDFTMATISLLARKTILGVLCSCASVLATGSLAFESRPPGSEGRLILAGHNPDIPAAVRRASGRVTAVGAPNEEGNILSFTVDITDLAPNELRSWRITFVSGELYAYVFQVRSNEGPVLTVTSLDGPLNGLAVGDGLLIEQTPIDRPTPQMRTPPAV